MKARDRLVDYHVHSDFSCDGKSSISDMCQGAVDYGYSELGFAEHVDFDPNDLGYGFFDYDGYSSAIQKAKEAFDGILVIHKCIEVDYQHRFEQKIRDWLKEKEFDFIIGSVHYLNGDYIDHRIVERGPLGKIYDNYFLEVTRSAESGLFDVIGHFDVVRRYLTAGESQLDEGSFWTGVQEVFGEILHQGVYLEINGKAFSEGYADTIPSQRVVKRYLSVGGKKISIGSDAHSAKKIGRGIPSILDFLSLQKVNGLQMPFSRGKQLNRSQQR